MDHEGYLGNDLKEYKEEVQSKYKDLVQFYKDFIIFLNKLRLDISVNDDDHQGIVIITIFSKMLETFQSMYLLFTNCLLSPAVCLSRVLFEEIVSISYCNKGQDEFIRFMARELYKKKKLTNVIEKNPTIFPKELVDKERIKKNREFIAKKLNEYGNPKEITIAEMAKEVDLQHNYEKFYRVSSNEVHTEPYILDRYLVFSKDGKLEAFSTKPETEGYAKYIISSIQLIMNVCLFFNNRFGIPSKEKIEELKSQIIELIPKYISI